MKLAGLNKFKVDNPGVATGNALSGDVLSSKTFSNDNGDGQIGSMPNRGAVTITPSTVNQAITAGYHNGSGIVQGDADLVAGNIKNGVNLFGVVGTAPIPSGTAVVADVLTGKTFSNSSSVGLTGTMSNQGAVNITPSTVNQAIPAGYHNGSGVVYGDANLIAGNIKNGVNIFGIGGSYVGGSIVSVQTGEAVGNVSVLINSVNTARAIVFLTARTTYTTAPTGTTWLSYSKSPRFTDSTHFSTDATWPSGTTTFRWTVIEFNADISVQSGCTEMVKYDVISNPEPPFTVPTNTIDVTLSSVNTSKAWAFNQSIANGTGGSNPALAACTLQIVNNTTLRLLIASSTLSTWFYWVVISFL